MPRLGIRAQAKVLGHIKLARLLSMREEEAERMAVSLAGDPLLKSLQAAGAVSRTPFPAAFFAAKRMAGRDLAPAQEGLGELLDGRSDLVRLMRRIGVARLQKHFLGEKAASDKARARACKITPEEARLLRGFLDRLYIRTEFETRAAAPVKTYSAVAGIGFRGGKAELRFFHREVWKGRYSVDSDRLSAYARGLDAKARERVRRILHKIELLDHRKTTLYRALEALLSAQADYLSSGDPARRQPLTQKSLAQALGVDASSLNRLISNKSVELPWGLEAPMKALLPSAKTLSRELVDALARERPRDSDEILRKELARRYNIFLSRRSIAQYRKELGVGASSRRRSAR